MNEAGGRFTFTMVALWCVEFYRWFSGPKLDAQKLEVPSRPLVRSVNVKKGFTSYRQPFLGDDPHSMKVSTHDSNHSDL